MGAEAAVLQKVEDYLKVVNYRNIESYIPSEFALNFVNFIKLVNGEEGEEHKTPVMHYRMLDNLICHNDPEMAKNPFKMLTNMCFRGSAKTTLLGEYMFLYLAVHRELPTQGEISLAMYVSDSIDNGVKNMRKNLEYRWENSEFLQHWIPEIKFTDIRWEFIRRDGQKFLVKAYGAKTGIRGVKEYGKRPNFGILDDLISDEDAKSPTVIENVQATVDKAFDYALHPSGHTVIWSGTPFNAKDPLYRAVESGAWKVNVFPVCEKFPCSKEEFRSAWPDRFTYEYVLAKYEKALKMNNLAGFYGELMLQIVSEEERMLDLEIDIRWYNFADIRDKLSAFNIYITTDFATSTKNSADDSVIFVWAVNDNGDWFWLDGFARKQTMDKNIDDLFNFAQIYRQSLQSVGVELSGQQGGFISIIRKEMMRKNIWFNFATEAGKNKEGISPVIDKFRRFGLVQPWFKAGKMFFPSEKREHDVLQKTMGQLELITIDQIKAPADDCIDGISMLGAMHTWFPSQSPFVIQSSSQTKIDTSIWGNPAVQLNDEASFLDNYIE